MAWYCTECGASESDPEIAATEQCAHCGGLLFEEQADDEAIHP